VPDSHLPHEQRAPLLHPSLKPQWSKPAPPPGFSRIAALLVPVTEASKPSSKWFVVHLNDAGEFAAELDDYAPIDWPFESGFLPTQTDWERLGIESATCSVFGDLASYL
jgi:hypothetical protein